MAKDAALEVRRVRKARMVSSETRSLLPICNVLPETRELVKCDGTTAIRVLRTKYRSDVGCQHGRLAETHEERHQQLDRIKVEGCGVNDRSDRVIVDDWKG